MSTRQQILNNLNSRLAAIAPAEGWGKKPLELNALPAIAWRDTVEKADDSIIGAPTLWKLRIAVAGYVLGEAAAARTILEQMLEAVGNDPRYNNLAEQTHLVSLQLKESRLADVVAVGLLVADIYYRSSLTGEIQPEENTLTADGEVLTADGEELTW